jgi:hypothetical protein
METTEKRRIPVKPSDRIKPLYDSQQIEQNAAVLNFFPAQASKNVTRNNYISNPLPGNDVRLIGGLSLDLNKQFIIDDVANGIDAAAIINALKHASIRITADQSRTEFLRAPIEEYSNFSCTQYEGDSAKAYVNGGYVTNETKTAVVASPGMYRLEDPFKISSQQTFDLEVTFNDASNFPTEAQWVASEQGLPWLIATLYAVEVDSDD